MNASEFALTLRPELLKLALETRESYLTVLGAGHPPPSQAALNQIKVMRRDLLALISRTKAAEKRLNRLIAEQGDWVGRP